MSDEPTQACTLAIESNDDDDDMGIQEKKNVGWATLKSLNPAYPDQQLIDDESSIGRHPQSTIVFNDKNISGTHCIIKKEPTTSKSDPIIAFLHDQSTNGTYINGVKVGKGNRHLLVKDQEIALVLGKNKASEKVSFLYRPYEKEDDEDGGPSKKYLVGETLGSGNFATVKLAVDRKTGEKYAIKIIDKKKYFMNSSSRKDALMDEVNILKGLNNGNIIHIQEVFDTEKTLYLILELVQGGELLNDILNNAFYQEDKAKLLFRQIVNGVQYLHDRGIAHRDLKPENILLKQKGDDLDPNDQNSIKLSDFGLSRTINEGSMMTTMCGTPQYLAPEIIMGTNSGGYGKEVDCWSMGGILYVMLCGYPPFDESKDISIFEQIRNAIFEFPEEDWSIVSDEAKDLIKRLMTVNPAKRYNCTQILNHPWFNSNASLADLIESDQVKTPSGSFNNGNSNIPKPVEKSNSVLGKRKSDDEDSIFSNKSIFDNNNSTSSNSSDRDDNNQKKIKLSKDTEDKKDDDDTDEEITTKDVDLPPTSSNSTYSNTSNTSSTYSKSSSPNNDNDSLFNNNNSKSDNTNNNTGSLFDNNNTNNNSLFNNHYSNTNNNNNSLFDNNNTHSLFDNNNKYDTYSSNDNSSDNNSIKQDVPSPQPVTPTKPKPSHYPVQVASTNQSPNPIQNKPTTPTKVDNRPMCKYGNTCYRKNPAHFKEYKHPLPTPQ